ncbi:CdaR family protein [Lacinutrix salivirga]
MIKTIKNKIVKSIKSRRLNVFIFFFMFAFIILLITKLSKDYTNTLSFSIKNKNLSEEIILINNNNTLQVTLKAQGFKFLKYYVKKPNLIIDFKEDVIKKDTFFLWTKNKGISNIIKQFSKNEDVITINPDSLVFLYDSYSKKRIPIVLNQNIRFNPGYNVLDQSLSLTPDSVTIIGAESIVKYINSVETEQLILENVNENISAWIKLKPIDTVANLKVSHQKVKLNAEVEKFTEGNLSIPIQIINTPKDLEVKFYPKAVKLKFYTSLKAFSSITEKDFKVICDFAKVQDNQNYMIPELVTVPKAVKTTKIDNKKIEFIIESK